MPKVFNIDLHLPTCLINTSETRSTTNIPFKTKANIGSTHMLFWRLY